MDSKSPYLQAVARGDFERARRRAFLHEIRAYLSRRSNDLLSFSEVQKALPPRGQIDRGMQLVPIAGILGSVDRAHDFDRDFLPLQTHTRGRWEAIDRAALAQENLPPIQLYQVGDLYFVKDGNHRVSVAKQQGQEFIEAEVIECPIAVPLTSANDAQDLLRLAEYARFLEQSHLDRLRPGVEIQFTKLGRYDQLIEHISAHRWYMGIEQHREIGWDEAVVDWYDQVYYPLVQVVRETGALNSFPGNTPGDLYLWIIEHRYYLEKDSGHPVGTATAVHSYDQQYAKWTRRVMRAMRAQLARAARPLAVSATRIRRALAAIYPDRSADSGPEAAESRPASTSEPQSPADRSDV